MSKSMTVSWTSHRYHGSSDEHPEATMIGSDQIIVRTRRD
jgi:hypothetical protein